MMLLSGSNVDDAQPISILSSASSSTFISSTDSVATIVKSITYEKVESILRHCDSKSSSHKPAYDTYSANTASVSNRSNNSRPRDNRNAKLIQKDEPSDEEVAYPVKVIQPEGGYEGKETKLIFEFNENGTVEGTLTRNREGTRIISFDNGQQSMWINKKFEGPIGVSPYCTQLGTPLRT